MYVFSCDVFAGDKKTCECFFYMYVFSCDFFAANKKTLLCITKVQYSNRYEILVTSSTNLLGALLEHWCMLNVTELHSKIGMTLKHEFQT